MLCQYKDSVATGDKMQIPVEAIAAALSSCFFGLIHDQNQVERTTERNSTADDVSTLRDRLDRYMTCMKEILSLEDMDVKLKEEAFVSIIDKAYIGRLSSI